jgi:hypothetical protein
MYKKEKICMELLDLAKKRKIINVHASYAAQKRGEGAQMGWLFEWEHACGRGAT